MATMLVPLFGRGDRFDVPAAAFTRGRWTDTPPTPPPPTVPAGTFAIRGRWVDTPPPQPTPPPRPTLGEILSDLGKLALFAGGAYVAWKGYRAMTETTRERHDRVLLTEAKREARAADFVFADVKGWAQPPNMEGHRADVVVVKRGRITKVIEVEHSHTLDTSHTIKQTRALAATARRIGARFEVVVT